MMSFCYSGVLLLLAAAVISIVGVVGWIRGWNKYNKDKDPQFLYKISKSFVLATAYCFVAGILYVVTVIALESSGMYLYCSDKELIEVVYLIIAIIAIVKKSSKTFRENLKVNIRSKYIKAATVLVVCWSILVASLFLWDL